MRAARQKLSVCSVSQVRLVVSLYKGAFGSCQGPNATRFSSLQWALVSAPVPYATLNSTVQWVAVGAAGWGVTGSSYSGNTSRAVCEWLGGMWLPVIPQSFDNVGVGLVTLFASSTAEGWNQVLYAAVDATGPDMQPVRDNNLHIFFAFALFMIIGAFFMMNLFVGVVIDNFNRLKVLGACVAIVAAFIVSHTSVWFEQAEMGDAGLLTASQREWLKAQKIMMHIPPMKKVRVSVLRSSDWRV